MRFSLVRYNFSSLVFLTLLMAKNINDSTKIIFYLLRLDETITKLLKIDVLHKYETSLVGLIIFKACAQKCHTHEKEI